MTVNFDGLLVAWKAHIADCFAAPVCDCTEPRIITQPSGRVICEGCGARLLSEPPKKERP